MASLSIRPVSMLASHLQRHGFENRGITHLRMETVELNDLLKTSETAEADEKIVVDRFIRMSSDEWDKWFFTDLDGHPILIGISPLKQD